MKRRYPLDTFVHRILLRRLIIVAVLVSLAVGGFAWFQIRDMVVDEAVEVALDRVAILRAHYRELLAAGLDREDAVAGAFAALGSMEFENRSGRFIHGVFHDRQVDYFTFSDSTHTGHRDAAAVVGDDRSRRPDLGDHHSSLVRVDGHHAVHVVIPIADIEGNLGSWATAVYVLSPAAAATLTREPLQAVGIVLVIVLVVASILYPVILRLARRLARFSGDLLEANLEMMEALGCAIAKRDGDTDAHNYRVTIYSVRLAEREGMSIQAMQGLIKGAFLHDIGKIGIRDDVLLKPGKLTDEEFAVMKSHVEHGLDIVGRAHWLRDALAVVGGHHEKYDGGGYPARVPGDMIPTAARIFAIADVFDALGSERPYKKAMPLEKVIQILVDGRGTHFDPALLAHFLSLAPEMHAEVNAMSIEELRSEMLRINSRYFAAGLETLLV